MSDYKDFVGSILNRAKGLADSEAVSGVVERVRGAAQNTGISEVFEKGSLTETIRNWSGSSAKSENSFISSPLLPRRAFLLRCLSRLKHSVPLSPPRRRK